MSHRIVILVLAVIATAPACSLRQDYPDTKRYAFEIRREGPSLTPAPDTTLMVSRFDISRRYEGEQMVYHLADGTWESDFYHRFFIAPAEMIAEETARWFGAARVTGTVLDPGSQVGATHAIEGTVTRLLGDYSEEDSAYAVVEMQLFGVDRTGTSGATILLSVEYEKRIAVPDRTSDALVKGWEQALREILSDFEGHFAKALAPESVD